MEISSEERGFWRYWLLGLALLAIMIAMNPFLATQAAPFAILDHQSAGTAARVNEIQQSWAGSGKLMLARASIAIDLVFIAVYFRGAWLGGRVMRRTGVPVLMRLGAIVMVAAIADLLLDYVETICQFIQIVSLRGDDRLAEIAATARPYKSVAFLVTFFGLLTALLVRRMTSKGA